MPAARTTRQHRDSPSAADIIDLDARRPVPAKRKHRANEVIEISSDDDDDVPLYEASRLQNELKQLKAQLGQLKGDTKRLRRERDKFKETVKQLEAEKEKEKEKAPAVLDPGDQETIALTKLEDELTCEICSLKMWHPYILPKCGHTFCESCLQGWFKTITDQHQAAHPNYNPNTPIPIPNFLRDAIYYGQIAPQQLIAMVSQIPTGAPSLTCPTCREPVKTPPIECFAIKSLVRTVAAAQGEESPKKPTAAAARNPGRGRRGTVPTVRNPWAAFFS